MNGKNVSDHNIFVLENAMSETLCDEVVNVFENSYKFQSRVGLGRILDKSIKDSTEVMLDPRNIIEHSCIYKKLYSQVFSDIKKLVEKYDSMKYFKYYDTEIELFKIQRTEAGHVCYAPHIDNSGCPSSKERMLAFIYYLNTVPEGGGTRFIHQCMETKAVKGNALFFPPFWTHEHEGINPISTHKIILNGFVKFMWKF